ncbi:MAG: hypothetical protein J3K34DRAFT_400964 [Monoraphidium minutum]|nr:MAG: hypothetical protein J3K34DRAFT_400964 [Monoraphidium minutum]
MRTPHLRGLLLCYVRLQARRPMRPPGAAATCPSAAPAAPPPRPCALLQAPLSGAPHRPRGPPLVPLDAGGSSFALLPSWWPAAGLWQLRACFKVRNAVISRQLWVTLAGFRWLE